MQSRQIVTGKMQRDRRLARFQILLKVLVKRVRAAIVAEQGAKYEA
jgi:hypothetical protein